MEGFIKLSRKILGWEWYDNMNTFKLFIHCLLKANWEAKQWHGVEIGAGQFVTSLAHLSKETHLSVRQVRVSLDHLQMTGELTSKSYSKYRIITVNNWSLYQTNDKQNDKIVDKQNDKQMTTTKEIKEKKKERKKGMSKFYDYKQREYDFKELEEGTT